jgi:23S rRNA (cytidine2498-2'-O)-methyltransferase
METDQFIFFCTNIGNENLLKAEIKNFYTELTLSYSRKGFITFKNLGVKYDIDSISQLEVAFATRVGICLGKARPEDIFEVVKKELDLSRYIIHNFSINTDYILYAEDIFNRAVNEYCLINKSVLNLISLGEKEVWFGLHKFAQNTTQWPNSNVQIDQPAQAPSNAYLKLAQIVSLFDIKFSASDNWLDFGSAPGGASYYLLDNGCRVWGIDTANMSQIISDDSKYTHIKRSVQDLSQEDLPDVEINWVHVDLNLNPKQSIKEVLRLCKKYNFTLRGIIFTVQMVNLDQVKNIESIEDEFDDWGFTDINSRQVPAHKQEYVLIGRRDRY